MLRYILLLLPFICISQTITLTDSDIKAFPTAEGYGQNATGGRGQNVYFVTNTNDSGVGSFRQAIDDADANNGGTIIFRTGGTVTLNSSIIAGSGGAENITIAGQTAPGDGFGVRFASGPTFGAAIELRGANTIMRFIRSQPGSNALGWSCDGIRIHNQWDTGGTYTLEDVIVDHCSVYWTTDEAIEIGAYHGGTVRNVTIQNTLVAEPLDEGYGPLIYRDLASSAVTSNITFYANMFNDVKDRTPSGSVYGQNYEVVNCIKYNVKNNVLVVYGNSVDHIGNIFKWNANVQPDLPYQIYTFNYDLGGGSGTASNGAVWEDDTILVGLTSGNGFQDADWTTYNNGSRINTSSPLTPMSSSLVSDFVSNNVGTKLWRSITNDHDTRVINNYLNGTGVHVTSETSVGGYLTYASGTPYADTDSDGLSDAYETANGGSVTSTVRPATATISDGTIIDQSGVTNYATQGYTHLDIFLADLAGDWDSYSTTPPVTPTTTRASLGPGKSVRVGGSNAKIYVGN